MASEIDEAGTAPAGLPQEESGEDQGRRWLDRLHLWALVELFVLSGFAIAQPLLDVTGKSPDFFLFRRADRLDIIVLVLGVLVLPAFFIWGFEVAVGLVSETVRRFLHRTDHLRLPAPAGPHNVELVRSRDGDTYEMWYSRAAGAGWRRGATALVLATALATALVIERRMVFRTCRRPCSRLTPTGRMRSTPNSRSTEP